MKDNSSFVDLLKGENLSKFDIGPRLIKTFTNVITITQKYFNEKVILDSTSNCNDI